MRHLAATLAVAFLFSATVACADEWTRTDTAFQAVSSALIVADWMQTRRIASERRYGTVQNANGGFTTYSGSPRWVETNPLLGENPSLARVDAYFAVHLVGNAAVAYLLPNPYRRIWQGATIAVQGYFVHRNYALGIRIGF